MKDQNTPTPQENALTLELNKRGIFVHQQYFDGYKHIDLYLPDARINIEVDGLQHLINPKRIVEDFHREYHADINGYHNIHITNGTLMHHLNEIADAIAEVVKQKLLIT